MRGGLAAASGTVRSGRWLLFLAAVAALGFGAIGPAGAAGVASETPKLFGSTEIRSGNMSKFEKWTEVLGRYAKEAPNELQKCAPTPFNPCNTARWRIFLYSLKDLPKRQQLDSVNAYLNKWMYIIDQVNWGKSDYWATPGQFLGKNGDCEDYAISKYVSLVHLGFDKSQLRIVVLNDLNLKVPHAILAVYLDGEVFILDNQIVQVVPADRIKHYKPIYSINEASWWLHRS